MFISLRSQTFLIREKVQVYFCIVFDAVSCSRPEGFEMSMQTTRRRHVWRVNQHYLRVIGEIRVRGASECFLLPIPIKFSARMRHRARGEKWEQPLGIARARPWNDPLGTDPLAKYGIRTALRAASSVMDEALIAPNGTFRIVFFFRSAGSAFLLLFRFTFSNFVLIYQTFGWCRAWTNKRKQNISRHEDGSIVSFESI